MAMRIGVERRYPEFLRRHSPPERSAPVIWPWKALADELNAAEHTEYGSLTLSMPNGDHQIVPGTAMTFQIVPPGGRTTPHSHSWWHLYFVRSGTGSVVFDDPGETNALNGGDILLIPAWTVHHL